MGIFKIDVDDFEWIAGVKDDPQDLCLHGRVTVHIGDTVLEDTGTVSATALYLLKTLTEDKVMGEHDIQMVPCCGHFLIANPDLTEVTIIGCDTGTDWSTVHNGADIKITLPSGQEETISSCEYREEVLCFADKVEAFYKSCTPKQLPQDEFHRNGYIAFWNEWRRRYNEAVIIGALDTGREVELSHNGLHFFLSHNKGKWSLYCEETKKMQIFDASNDLYSQAKLEGALLRDEFHRISIDCIL